MSVNLKLMALKHKFSEQINKKRVRVRAHARDKKFFACSRTTNLIFRVKKINRKWSLDFFFMSKLSKILIEIIAPNRGSGITRTTAANYHLLSDNCQLNRQNSKFPLAWENCTSRIWIRELVLFLRPSRFGIETSIPQGYFWVRWGYSRWNPKNGEEAPGLQLLRWDGLQACLGGFIFKSYQLQTHRRWSLMIFCFSIFILFSRKIDRC